MTYFNCISFFILSVIVQHTISQLVQTRQIRSNIVHDNFHKSTLEAKLHQLKEDLKNQQTAINELKAKLELMKINEEMFNDQREKISEDLENIKDEKQKLEDAVLDKHKALEELNINGIQNQ